MNLKEIILLDLKTDLVSAWSEAFSRYDWVKPERADFFSKPAAAMVSPANSFGIMDGGLDRAIRHELGFGVERKAQEMIIERYHGEMPVGVAEVVPTDDERWPFLVVAPTMRVPEPMPTSISAYLSFRAVVLAVARHNTQTDVRPIQSLVCPGMATGVGRMSARRCAAQMKVALDEARRNPEIPSFDRIHKVHQALRLQ